MSVSLTHALWIWLLAFFLFLIMLVDVFKVAVPEILIGVVAGLTVLFIFVQIGPTQPAP